MPRGAHMKDALLKDLDTNLALMGRWTSNLAAALAQKKADVSITSHPCPKTPWAY